MESLSVADLKATLPNFPDEVLEEWLLPYARSRGWPPFQDSSSEPVQSWSYLLLKQPLEYWRAVHWQLETFELELDHLEPSCQETMAQKILAAAKGERNLYSKSIPDLNERFSRIFEYLVATERLPCPPALVRMEHGLRIMDGNHRTAALIFYKALRSKTGTPAPPQSFWVGSLQPNKLSKPTPLRGAA